jgi:DNA-binding IscR family transcriptional regulator
MVLIYLFHILQTAGILFTALSNSEQAEHKEILMMCGLLCQIGAAVLSTLQHVNESISETTLKDIVAIKDGTYVDEGVITDDDKR